MTEVDIVERHLPPPRVLPAAAQHRLDQLTHGCARTLDQRQQHLGAHGVAAGDAARSDRAAQLLVDRQARHLTATHPNGSPTPSACRPANAHEASLWDHVVEAVARYRLRHDLPTHTPTIGPPPALDPTGYRTDQPHPATPRHPPRPHHP